jgi:hypothetical protein
MIRSSVFVAFLISCIHISILHGNETAGHLFQAGPMVGHVDDSSGVVWLRIRIGAELKATAAQDGAEAGPSRVEDLGGGCYRLHFGGLEPVMETSVRIEVSRSGDETEIREANFRAAHAAFAEPSVRASFFHVPVMDPRSRRMTGKWKMGWQGNGMTYCGGSFRTPQCPRRMPTPNVER